MPLKLNNGSPVRSPSVVEAMAKKIATENPVEFSPNAPRSGQVQNREFPIIGMWFELAIEITGASGAEVMSPFGPLNLIRTFKIAVDGTDGRFDCLGRNLATLHHLYQGHAPYHDVNVAASGTYYAHFYVPFDVGGYMSLLDVSQNTSLDVQVQWGAVSDLFSGGTASVGKVELAYEVDYVTGAPAGQMGGKGYPYARQFVHTNRIDITSTKADHLLEKLTAGRGYHGATLFCYDNGALSNGIVNSVELVRADSQHFRETWRRCRARNRDQFDLQASDDWTGILHLPMVAEGHMEHILSVRNDQAMRLRADVTKTANDCEVELVTHYLKN